MRRFRLTAVIAVGCSVVLGGCGSSPRHTSKAGNANGEAEKSPGQIVADAAAALRTAHGYVMQGTITENQQLVHLKVSVATPRSIDVAFSVEQSAVEILTLANASYIRANRAFWTTHLGARGATLANRWIQAQPADAQSMTSSLGHFAPATLARCLTEDHGKLTLGGRATLDGRPAVIVKDAGNVPGGSPGTLAVATTGPPYPLQVVSTGPQRPGGHVDVCNDGKADDSRGKLTFSQFGAVKPVSPPTTAVRPGSLSS